MQKYVLYVITSLSLIIAVSFGALYMQSQQVNKGYSGSILALRQELDTIRAQKAATEAAAAVKEKLVDIATQPWETYTSPDGRTSFQYPKELFAGEKAPLSFSVLSKKESEAQFDAEVAKEKAKGNVSEFDGVCDNLGDLDCIKDEWQKSYTVFQKVLAGEAQTHPSLSYERMEIPLIAHVIEQIHSLPFFIGLSQPMHGGSCLVDYITYTKDVRVRFTARCEDEKANYLSRDEASLSEANNILTGTRKSDLDKSRRTILRQMANTLIIK